MHYSRMVHFSFSHLSKHQSDCRQIIHLSQGFVLHYHKTASEHPSNKTAVEKFFMDFLKFTSVLIFSVVPGNGLRAWDLSSLRYGILQNGAGLF